jgi:hypothetical protein
MQYIIYVTEYADFVSTLVSVKSGDVVTSFQAEETNPVYNDFLEQAQLTDIELHALKPDVWYDFPNGDK